MMLGGHGLIKIRIKTIEHLIQHTTWLQCMILALILNQTIVHRTDMFGLKVG